MSIEESISELTEQTSELLEVIVVLKDGVAQQISDAVIVSQNEAIIPLANSVTRLIQTQTLFINLLNK
jgi:hypothetical protein